MDFNLFTPLKSPWFSSSEGIGTNPPKDGFKSVLKKSIDKSVKKREVNFDLSEHYVRPLMESITDALKGVIEHEEQHIQDLNQTIVELRDVISDKDQQINELAEELRTVVTDKDRQMSNLKDVVICKERQIEDLISHYENQLQTNVNQVKSLKDKVERQNGFKLYQKH